MRTRDGKKAAAMRRLVQADLETFARKAFRTASGEDLSDDCYIGVVLKAVRDVHEHKVKRLVFSMPPRHGKTLVFTVVLTAWELAHRPSAKIIIVCYSANLARDISDKVRDVLRASWFRKAFPETRLRRDHDRAMDFSTTAGGQVYANHLGPGITGHGADLIIADDIHDIGDARAPHRLAEAIETFFSDVLNRVNHPSSARIAIVGHRLHPNDLCGYVVRAGGWTQVKVPFVAERDETYATLYGVWHRRQGELLRVGEYTDAEVEILRRLTTVPNFDTLYQQSPPEALWRISPDDFPLFEVLPAGVGGAVISVDAGHVPGERNSFSVIQVWRSAGPHHFLIEQWRGKVTPTELEKVLRSIISRYRPGVVLIERASAGISLLTALERRSQHRAFILEAISPGNRPKVERFAKVVATIASRLVCLPAGDVGTSDLIDELTSFPDGAADDQVDALTQYLIWQADHPRVSPPPPHETGAGRIGGRRFAAGQIRNFFQLPTPYIFVRKGKR